VEDASAEAVAHESDARRRHAADLHRRFTGADPRLGILLTYAGPVSNDAVGIDFNQSIGAAEALRTGSYSKTLMLTLSTTNP
jgi:hypothetical protein